MEHANIVCLSLLLGVLQSLEIREGLGSPQNRNGNEGILILPALFTKVGEQLGIERR